MIENEIKHLINGDESDQIDNKSIEELQDLTTLFKKELSKVNDPLRK